MIDIGGTSLLRSSAKNFQSITAICNISDYDKFIINFKKNNGKTSLNFRKQMATKVFNTTANYDNSIAKWIKGRKKENKLQKTNKRLLRYGENPHQKAFYIRKSLGNNFIDGCIKKGKEISYNNILDIDSAYNCVYEFKEPTCVIVKHNNPCGVASNKRIIQAYKNAYKCDPISSFGGIVAINRKVDKKLAKIFSLNFFEIIVADSFDKKATEILNKRKNLILIETKKIKKNNNYEIKSINEDYVFQEKNKVIFSKKDMECATRKKASKTQIKNLIFSFKVCKHIKSNAIVLVKNMRTVGIGAGQASRIDSTKLALSKIPKKLNMSGFVAASDAFFPFIDNIKLLIKNNCNTIIQPKGSINDKKIINFANKKNISIYFSKYRFFKH